jgi:hypothetical protein
MPTANLVVSAYCRHYDEDVTDLLDINDIRNGVFANILIRTAFDQRRSVVLILFCTFVPSLTFQASNA